MTFRLRRSLALVLIVALTFAGLGRAHATVADGAVPFDPVPGVHVPFCHSGAGEAPADPGRRARRAPARPWADLRTQP